jgi:hypothetical protein
MADQSMDKLCAYQDLFYRPPIGHALPIISIDGNVQAPRVEALVASDEEIELCREKYCEWLSAQGGELMYNYLTSVKAEELKILSALMEAEIARRSREEEGYRPPSSPWSHPCCPNWGPLEERHMVEWRRKEVLDDEPKQKSASSSSSTKRKRRTPVTRRTPGMRGLILDMRQDLKEKERCERALLGKNRPSPLARQVRDE